MTDEYLDSTRQINKWRAAKQKGNLDERALLDELAKAVLHCEMQENENRKRGDAYGLARAAYLTEAHEFAYRNKTVGGFSGWCKTHGINQSGASFWIRVANAADPIAMMNKRRQVSREAARNKVRQLTGSDGIDLHDPLRDIKRRWRNLSPLQKQAFLTWIAQEQIAVKDAA